MVSLRRVVPPLLLVAAVAGFWASGLASHLNWATLSRNQAVLAGWIARHRVVAPVVYAAVYALITALSVPEAAVLTVIGGWLFGAWLGGSMAVIGATVGAVILFVVARSAFAGALAARGGQRLARIRSELHRDGFSYLLALRLIPVVPFWLINLAAALAGMRVMTFGTATLIGIIPVTFIYAWVGVGIGGVLASGQRPDLMVLFSPQILAPLAALGLLALLPVVWRKWKGPNG